MPAKTRRFIFSSKSCSCSMPGVRRAVAYCRGVVVIFHSPAPCAHLAHTMDISSQYRSIAEGSRERLAPVPVLASQMEEKDAIFGGTERLRQCIAYAVAKYHPQCLVLANSCVAGVIGDDVESVGREAEQQYGIPVLTTGSCGFLDGEYFQGYYEITQQLVARFLKPRARIPGTVLLLGDNGGPWGHYATEVTRLLGLMGIEVIGQFPAYMSFSELPRAASASAVLILGSRGVSHKNLRIIARQMEESLHMPFLDLYPLGWRRTERWLRAVGDLLHYEKAAADVLWRERARLLDYLGSILDVTKKKRTVLCIGRQLTYYHPASILETIRRLQLDLLGIVLLDAYTERERREMTEALRACTKAPVYNTASGAALMRGAELVLTTHELQDPDLKQIFLPMLPLVGTEGELALMRVIYRTLCSKIKGGLTYA